MTGQPGARRRGVHAELLQAGERHLLQRGDEDRALAHQVEDAVAQELVGVGVGSVAAKRPSSRVPASMNGIHGPRYATR